MTRNDYDKASRFAAKLDPPRFLEWALGLTPTAFQFEEWLDTRSVPFPGDKDRTGDTVARVTDPASGGRPWAIAVEFQNEPDPRMFGRLLGYLSGIWLEKKPDPEAGSRFEVGAVVVNLTGRGNASREMRWPAAGLATQLVVRERNLQDESAADLLATIESGGLSRALLPWIPLMTGGDDPGIIERWKRVAEAEPDLRERANYAAPALALSEAAGRQLIWTKALEDWNVQKSTIVEGWVKQARVEGRVEESRAIMLRQGKKKFGRLPTKKQQAELDTINDPARLQALSERLLDVNTWGELLAE